MRMNQMARVGSPLGLTTKGYTSAAATVTGRRRLSTSNSVSGYNDLSKSEMTNVSGHGILHQKTRGAVHPYERHGGKISNPHHKHKVSDSMKSIDSYEGGNDVNFIAPVTVHVNYCGNKKTCLKEKGLW